MPSTATTQRIQVFGFIGDEFSVQQLSQQLNGFDRTQPLTVEINSDGGSVSEGVSAFNLLRAWPGGVTVEVIGWALSAATIVAMAGRTIRIHETSLMMVHAPWLSTSGNAAALRDAADRLDQVAESLLAAYRRTGRSDAQIRAWLDGADHWFTAEEAVAAGLANEVIPADERSQAALAHVALASCRHPIPPHIQRTLAAMPQSNTAPAGGAQQANTPAAQVAEQRRREEIRAVFDSHLEFPGMLAAWRECERDESVDVVKARAVVLNTLSKNATSAMGAYCVTPDGDTDRMRDFKAAATDVLLMRAGFKVAEPHPAARDLQRLGIVSMAERMLSMMGRSTRDLGNNEIVAMALSTSDFPSLLSGVSGKSLRDGYESAPATFAGWTGERDVPDFKLQTLVALSEAPGLLKVLEGAEYKFGKFDDSASTFRVETFGRVISITRQALVNDDLQAFTSLPRTYGAAARRLEADMVYSRLTSAENLSDGSPLFHANHGNLGTASNSLNVAGLAAARSAMRKQKGIQGLGYVDPQPRYLIVPVSLETAAEQLLASLVDPSKSNDTPQLEWIRGLTLAADPRLDAASETHWYLSADPAQIEGIVRAYLSGARNVHLEENNEFVRDAMSHKVRMDVGVGIVDYRALFKTPSTF